MSVGGLTHVTVSGKAAANACHAPSANIWVESPAAEMRNGLGLARVDVGPTVVVGAVSICAGAVGDVVSGVVTGVAAFVCLVGNGTLGEVAAPAACVVAGAVVSAGDAATTGAVGRNRIFADDCGSATTTNAIALRTAMTDNARRVGSLRRT